MHQREAKRIPKGGGKRWSLPFSILAALKRGSTQALGRKPLNTGRNRYQCENSKMLIRLEYCLNEVNGKISKWHNHAVQHLPHPQLCLEDGEASALGPTVCCLLFLRCDGPQAHRKRFAMTFQLQISRKPWRLCS